MEDVKEGGREIKGCRRDAKSNRRHRRRRKNMQGGRDTECEKKGAEEFNFTTAWPLNSTVDARVPVTGPPGNGDTWPKHDVLALSRGKSANGCGRVAAGHLIEPPRCQIRSTLLISVVAASVRE